MNVELGKIFGKRHDYVVCLECKAINFHTNTNCHSCNNTSFTLINSHLLSTVLDKIYDEYKAEGLEEQEIDKITLDV